MSFVGHEYSLPKAKRPEAELDSMALGDKLDMSADQEDEA